MRRGVQQSLDLDSSISLLLYHSFGMTSSLSVVPRNVSPPGCHLDRRERSHFFRLSYGGNHKKNLSDSAGEKNKIDQMVQGEISKAGVWVPLAFSLMITDRNGEYYVPISEQVGH